MKHHILAAATLGAALVVAPEAMAQTVRLEATGPAENFVEWTGAHGANIVAKNIRGRVISVTATTNSPIELEGACPPPSSYPGWRLATGNAPTDGSDHAEVDEDSVARTGENGTFSLRFTAPSRVGQILRADIACVHDTDSSPTATNIDQTEKLTAEIMAVGAGSSGSDFLYRGPVPGSDEEEETPSRGLPMNACVAVAVISAITGEAALGTNLGFLAKLEAGDDFNVGLVYRMGTVAEFARNSQGERMQRIGRSVHGGFAMLGLNPKPVPGKFEYDISIGPGVTGAPATTLESQYVPNGRARVREISAKIAGRLAGAIRLSWDLPVQLELGGDVVVQPDSQPLNSAGFWAGVNVPF